jgi:hypothetical protein
MFGGEAVAYPLGLIRNILNHEWSPSVVRRLLGSGVVMVPSPGRDERAADEYRAIARVTRRLAARHRSIAEIKAAVIAESQGSGIADADALAFASEILKSKASHHG